MKKVLFKNSNGLKLVGVLHVTNTDSKKAVVIAHGFTSNKDRERHIKLARTLSENGIITLRFDFGGSGESESRGITIRAQVDDLNSAISYLKDKGYDCIGVLGESLGGITALEAYNKDIKTMVLWAPVTKAGWTSVMSEQQKEQLKKYGYYIHKKDGKDFRIPQEYMDERKSLRRENILGRVKIPVLIIHGTSDKTIPIAYSEEAVKLLPKGSKLERIKTWEHGDHQMNSDMDTIIPITLDWFVKHLNH